MAQHNFENDNKYHQRSEQARRSTLVSVVVNIFLSALQIAVGIFSGSQGLIADGMHSFSDLLADGVVLVANKRVADRLTTITIMATGAMRTAPLWSSARSWCWSGSVCCGLPRVISRNRRRFRRCTAWRCGWR